MVVGGVYDFESGNIFDGFDGLSLEQIRCVQSCNEKLDYTQDSACVEVVRKEGESEEAKDGIGRTDNQHVVKVSCD